MTGPSGAEHVDTLLESGAYVATQTVWGARWTPATIGTSDGAGRELVTVVALLLDEGDHRLSHYVLEDGRAILPGHLQLLADLAGALTQPDWRQHAVVDHDLRHIRVYQFDDSVASVQLFPGECWTWLRTRIDERPSHQLSVARPVAEVAAAIRQSLRPATAAPAASAAAAVARRVVSPPAGQPRRGGTPGATPAAAWRPPAPGPRPGRGR